MNYCCKSVIWRFYPNKWNHIYILHLHSNTKPKTKRTAILCICSHTQHILMYQKVVSVSISGDFFPINHTFMKGFCFFQNPFRLFVWLLVRSTEMRFAQLRLLLGVLLLLWVLISCNSLYCINKIVMWMYPKTRKINYTNWVDKYKCHQHATD